MTSQLFGEGFNDFEMVLLHRALVLKSVTIEGQRGIKICLNCVTSFMDDPLSIFLLTSPEYTSLKLNSYLYIDVVELSIMVIMLCKKASYCVCLFL